MQKLINGARKLGLELGVEQVQQFETYYQELVDWNQRMNLTAITNYEEAQIKHFLDSLTVLLAIETHHRDGRVIDIGTGAGLPGLPIKIALPATSVVLLEATAKKATFLEAVRQKLGLDDVEVVVGRAEEVAHQPKYRENFDVVLSRAVAALPALVELTLPFCRIGGRTVAQKKGNISLELSQAARAVTLLGGSLHEVKSVPLEELPDNRVLVVIDKVTATPPAYPRHPGLPAKRPILPGTKIAR